MILADHFGGHVQLSSRRVRLVPVGPAERAALFSLATNPELAFRWRSVGPGTHPRVFDRLMDENVLCQFGVCSTSSTQLVGLVQCVAASFHHQTAQITVLLAPRVWGNGWALEGVMLFMAYVFTGYPLRKLYFEIPEQNWSVLRRGASRLFSEEGVLIGHEWHLGLWRDVALYSVSCEQFFTHRLTARLSPDSSGRAVRREEIGALGSA